jgi:hypothetical protein
MLLSTLNGSRRAAVHRSIFKDGGDARVASHSNAAGFFEWISSARRGWRQMWARVWWKMKEKRVLVPMRMAVRVGPENEQHHRLGAHNVHS